MFKIEKDVPMSPAADRGRPPIYPFGQMEIGDSFAIPADADGYSSGVNGQRRHKVRIAASAYGKAHGLRFATRMLPDGSVRIWRTA